MTIKPVDGAGVRAHQNADGRDAPKDAEGATFDRMARRLIDKYSNHKPSNKPRRINHQALASAIKLLPSGHERDALLRAVHAHLLPIGWQRLNHALDAGEPLRATPASAPRPPSHLVPQVSAAPAAPPHPAPSTAAVARTYPYPTDIICPACFEGPPTSRTARRAPTTAAPAAAPPGPATSSLAVAAAANPVVDAAARLIADKLSELEAAVPAEPRPGFVVLQAEAYNNARLQFQRRVETALQVIGGAVNSLSSGETEQLLGRLSGRQLDSLAVLDSHYQGLKDAYSYDWQYLPRGNTILDIRRQLQPNTVAAVIPNLAKKTNGVDQIMRLLDSYQNASQIDRSPPLLLKAMAPVLSIINQPRWLGTPNYPKYIREMGDDYLARADRSSKLALIEKLGPLVQANVSYPPTISNPSGTANPTRIGAVIQYEHVFGSLAADAIASLDGDRPAVMQVFKALPAEVLQRIGNAAVQPFRQVDPWSGIEISVGANPGSLIRMIKTAAGPGLIGDKGSLGDRGWTVKGAMFTYTVRAIDNLVRNKFYSARAPYANHLIAGGNSAVIDITNAAIELAESAPHYLMAGLRKDEGLEPTGETWTKFIVYLHDEKLMTALYKGADGAYPLIDEGGRLARFVNLLYGNKTGPERVEYSLAGQVPGYPAPGVDSFKANVTANIGYAMGGLIGSNNMLRLLVEQEAALLIQHDSVLSVALKELPLGSGKVIGYLVSPAVKGLIGEDIVQNNAAIIERAQRLRTNVAEQSNVLYQRIDPSKNKDLLETRFYKDQYKGTEASPGELWMLRDIMASFDQKMNLAMRYGNTFGGSTLDYRPGTGNDRPQGIIPRAWRYLFLN
jgi:hypothetical protein